MHDLSNFSDEQIKGRVITRIALVVLKHIFDKPEDWDNVLKLLEQLFLELSINKSSLDFLRATLKYLFNSAEVSAEDVKKVIETTLGQKGSEVFMTVREKWKKETEHEIAKRMLRRGDDVNSIMEITDLSLDEIEKLKAKI